MVFLRPGGTVKLYLSVSVELYTVFSDPKNLAKNPGQKSAQNVAKNLAQNLVKNLARNPGRPCIKNPTVLD